MKNIEELNDIREKARREMALSGDGASGNIRVVVGMATCGIAAGARPVLAACMEEVKRRSLRGVTVTQVGCVGVCRLEPIMEVLIPGESRVTYVNMTPEKAKQVMAEHVVNRSVKTEYTYAGAAREY